MTILKLCRFIIVNEWYKIDVNRQKRNAIRRASNCGVKFAARRVAIAYPTRR